MKKTEIKPYGAHFIEVPLNADAYYKKYVDLSLDYKPKKFVFQPPTWYQRLSNFSSQADEFVFNEDVDGFVEYDNKSIFLRRNTLATEIHELGHFFIEDQDSRSKIPFMPFEQYYVTDIMHEGLAEWFAYYIGKTAKNINLKLEIPQTQQGWLNPDNTPIQIDKNFMTEELTTLKQRFKYRPNPKEILGMESAEYRVGLVWALHHMDQLITQGFQPKKAMTEVLKNFPRQLNALDESVRDINPALL